ncbi:MAG: M23 family metallopeptidase [Verrucomicrobiaceae bacterium]|nr:M23 family metallopeptidase [Verrucomicrobiaceae bacterium]
MNMNAIRPWLLLCLVTSLRAQVSLVLPTENDALLRRQPESYFQFVDRSFEGEKTTPWEGGQFGFVRDPRRVGGGIAYARFHEGLDVKPLRRDAKGDPLDEVRAIADGEVVYVTAAANLSNYGRYIVLRHDFPGTGPLFSLYAHLREARVAAGQRVKAGQGIGLLGYTGAGIDQRRAHVHVELNLLLNSQFDAWHAAHFTTPNHHGIYNGMNLIGTDLQALFLARQRDPGLSLDGFLRGLEEAYRVRVPAAARMEIVRLYPWLVASPGGKAASWEVSFTRWGQPLAVRGADEAVAEPVVSAVRDSGLPHYLHTRGIVTGSGSSGKLTVEGLRFVKLVCGLP